MGMIEDMGCHKVLTYMSFRLDEIKMENDVLKKQSMKAKLKSNGRHK